MQPGASKTLEGLPVESGRRIKEIAIAVDNFSGGTRRNRHAGVLPGIATG
jgi:hypothetical protein